MTKDINQTSFPESTKLKLQILSDFFDEWFPVFLMTPNNDKLFIIDFFAGSGTDADGIYGSPLALLNEAKKFCKYNKKKDIVFMFNEKDKDKYIKLQENIDNFMNECKSDCLINKCLLNIKTGNNIFKEIFFTDKMEKFLKNKDIAKFLFLDQYGIKEVNDDVFKLLIDKPKTDFIFFISSSILKRFHAHEFIKKYINIEDSIKEVKYSQIHLEIVKYYKELIPKDMECYIHGFSFKKGSNYYGLVFGSSHTLGIEKFLKVCWKHDNIAGASNHNIYEDFNFLGIQSKNIVEKVSKELEEQIYNKSITTNIQGFKYALKNGCLPVIFKDLIKKMENDKKVKLIPINGRKISHAATNIHKVDEYKIEVL